MHACAVPVLVHIGAGFNHFFFLLMYGVGVVFYISLTKLERGKDERNKTKRAEGEIDRSRLGFQDENTIQEITKRDIISFRHSIV